MPGLYDTIDFDALINNNKAVKKAKADYDKLNNSEYKYLIDSGNYRNVFISGLNDELEKIRKSETFGYNNQYENDRFKEAVMEEILRILHINYNYDIEKINRDNLMHNTAD